MWDTSFFWLPGGVGVGVMELKPKKMVPNMHKSMKYESSYELKRSFLVVASTEYEAAENCIHMMHFGVQYLLAQL